MGWLSSGLTFPVSCLILVWAAGSGSVKTRQEPTCLTDYISTSTCEWEMAGPTNCSTELRLTYQLNFIFSENYTCVPENRDSTVCTCDMLMDNVVSVDIYQLDLWAGKQLLWTASFKPSEHVKPRAPGNLTVHANVSHTWLLTWSNPYPPESHLNSEITYLVNVSNENDPKDFKIYNVTYLGPTLRIAASTLKSGASYSARVKAWAQSYNSSWSEWSPSATWLNYYQEPLEQRLPLGVSISCVIILAICLSCYFSIIKIKKEWWDQIPNPAHSPLVAIVIQDSQVSLWGKRSRVQEAAKCPHWKTCLTKLLPCFLEHGMEKDEDSSKAARNGLSQGPRKSAWHPVEVSKTILWPESISVVRCVELFEAPVENEEEEVEEDKGSFCPSPESSGGSFQEGREGIAARLTESLFLDLLGGENGGLSPQGLEESCLLPSSEDASTQMPWAEFPSVGPQKASSSPPATLTQSPASLAFPEMPAVIANNPAYRSFSTCLNQSSGSEECDSDPQPAERWGNVEPVTPAASQLSEPLAALQPDPETWEEILRQSVLQHRTAPAAASAPGSGYREFVRAVREGNAQDSGAAGLGPSGEAGYKAFSSLLTGSAICPGTSGVEPGSGQGGYKPFQSLTPGCPGTPATAPIPSFTFGLDVEPPHSPQDLLFLGRSAECPSLEPVVKGEDGQKPLHSPEQAPDPLRDENDLGSGIVYSALTCHLCGHLKQCHGQEERGKTHVMASPCCGCCCGDRSSPLVSPLRSPDSLPGGVPPETSLCLASLAPLGVSEEGKFPLSFQTAPSNAQSSSQPPTAVAVLSPGPTCTDAS
ncbi:interleukin-4 receptor subunit alpha isoform X1 [Camelus ferus]|uniref:Interleukin-4 receptor subunit alpha n=1 Tax=Camelus ferus TaxID=419612 RepID=S9Y6E3_CAMFR|nr:interleukin-4 receptor subunit alpha isoform X1 [Camelus ferus]XP_010989216.2 interleukin-4 receptor subunit alpha isoform X1 [Camelus dromedarius]XP_031288875.1 interleukin-4 receptor subunit alpha isoform X1 [Camelus dromedarius]XP_031288876.1 interleukin-4 receptor subunit alpha isoform X1 [Camelus dromedarius]XP_031288877.1 interleukin-4 receptor subunit alpha isoform X1 [Camelus dromedarius]XP_032316478.1 interleukin-4 receptor subunit alpha isoform X1 [Camelus ferus]XP_032316480.1 in